MPEETRVCLVSPDLTTRANAPATLKIRREHDFAADPIEPLRYPWYLPCKYALDFVLALLLLLPALAVVLLSALVVKLTSPGPAFYTQVRVGLRGRLFRIYKVRTMIHNCESLTGPRWSMPGDPRVTWFGRLLRVSHLDELPQLLNVLRGEMSLVGPRPERPEFMPELEQALPTFPQRLNVRPGVTGLAQVQLPSDSDLHSTENKLTHDLYYIRHLSPWLDLRLLLCTVFAAMGVPFRWSGGWLRVPDSEAISDEMEDMVGQCGSVRAAA